jgi:glycosyltransferase involved in cell wall biosynthesis
VAERLGLAPMTGDGVPTRAGRAPRVLRVITRLVVSGPSTHVVLADRGLRARGWETLLVHGVVEPDEAEIDVDALDIPTLRVPALRRPLRPGRDLSSVTTMARLIRRFRPDIIHTHQSKAGLITRSAALLVAPRVRRVHTFHGTIFGGYFGARTTGAFIRAERFLGHRTDRVIALSETLRSELLARDIAPEKRIAVVPLGLDLERFARGDRAAARRVLGLAPQAGHVVWLGRLAPIKRVDRLIQAFGGVHRRLPEAHLTIVGDGALRPALEAQVRAAGLTEAVTFAGWSSDTPTWYAAADVVVLTSDSEGTPLSVIEAAAAGRPVVSTDVGGVRDVLTEGVSGYLVPVDDMAGLTERIVTLLRDPARAATFGAAGLAAVGAFGSERLVDDLDRLYRGLLEEVPRGTTIS